jgi:hypothetical protein
VRELAAKIADILETRTYCDALSKRGEDRARLQKLQLRSKSTIGMHSSTTSSVQPSILSPIENPHYFVCQSAFTRTMISKPMKSDVLHSQRDLV